MFGVRCLRRESIKYKNLQNLYLHTKVQKSEVYFNHINSESKMRISVAQIESVKGDIANNIIKHKKVINLAIKNKVEVIVFPELSLTGYEPTLAKN